MPGHLQAFAWRLTNRKGLHQQFAHMLSSLSQLSVWRRGDTSVFKHTSSCAHGQGKRFLVIVSPDDVQTAIFTEADYPSRS
jgi:hypothetical protein